MFTFLETKHTYLDNKKCNTDLCPNFVKIDF